MASNNIMGDWRSAPGNNITLIKSSTPLRHIGRINIGGSSNNSNTPKAQWQKKIERDGPRQTITVYDFHCSIAYIRDNTAKNLCTKASDASKRATNAFWIANSRHVPMWCASIQHAHRQQMKSSGNEKKKSPAMPANNETDWEPWLQNDHTKIIVRSYPKWMGCKTYVCCLARVLRSFSPSLILMCNATHGTHFKVFI